MSYVKNVAVNNFGMGKFISSSTGLEVTAGTPSGAYRADASSGALTGSASYDATLKGWIWSTVQAGAMNGDDITLTFDLTGCIGISHTIRTGAVAPDTNVVSISGTSQTGRDIGASVLLSSGTGTGQISLASGAVLLQATQTGVTIPTVTALTNDPSKYTHGAVWIDSVNGAAGSASYTNGIMTNPVTSLADAKSIGDNLKLKKFWIQSGSDLTLAAAYVGYIFDGFGYTLALGGRDISGATIRGCETLTGIATSPTRECYVWDSQLGACTFGEVDLHGCHLTGVLTLGAATSYLLANCVGVPTGTPSIDFGSAIGSSTVVCTQWGGPLTVDNLKTGDVLHLDGGGDLTLAASCTGGTVYISGAFTLTNSGSGMTINDTARWNEDQNITTATNLTNAPTNGDLTATMKVSVTQAVWQTIANVTGAVATDAGNSATTFKTNMVEATNDYWKDALIVLTSGAMAGQVKRIWSYNGTTKAITVAGGFTGIPADGVTFVVLNK